MNQFTVCGKQPRYMGACHNRDAAMDSKIDFRTIIVAICVAGYAAITLAYLAQNNLGLSAAQTRHFSMIAAVFLACPVVLDLLRAKVR